MTFQYSQPFETLLEQRAAGNRGGAITQARVVIIGSGYGGSVAAFLLASRNPTHGLPHDVIVLERGQEYALGDFPNDLEDLPPHLQVHGTDGESSGRENALFDVRLGDNVYALVGSGLGGTSLINANVAIAPNLKALARSPWPREFATSAAQGQLKAALGSASAWLGVNPAPPVAAYPKYRALSSYATALGLKAAPAPLTVTFATGPNGAGVIQNACTGCGNCISGCNVGSKNTLAMNLIPAARANGAEFLTGAVAYAVEPIDNGTRWRVHVRPASPLSSARVEDPIFIEAETVILAAGTFGSTEILARSQRRGYIECSARLGQRFSTNGDGLSMSFGENTRVNAVGDRAFNAPAAPSGPTITATAFRKSSPAFLLEEGSIPAPLLEIIGEMVTTSAQIGRLGWNKLPAWLRARPAADPSAVHRGALDHSQVFLVMSDDKAAGSLEFRGDPTQPDDGGIVPIWPMSDDGVANPTLKEIEARLSKHDREQGLKHGQYVHNPIWQTLPEATAGLEGKFPGGRLLTVHPLGGCCMGNSAQDGVVDHVGQVFRRGGKHTYRGLHVLDGSIIPGALGHNPFLTIATLAWRACLLIGGVQQPVANVQQPVPSNRPLRVRQPGEDEIIIREQLVGRMDASPAARQAIEAAIPGSARWFEHEGLILRVATQRASTPIVLSGTGRAGVDALLFRHPDTAAQAQKWHTYGVKASRLTAAEQLGEGNGSLTLMEAMPWPNKDELRRRRESALDEYEIRRERPWWLAALRLRIVPLVTDSPPIDFPGLREAWGFLTAAEMQCTYRRFDYDLHLVTNGRPIMVTGQKLISWSKGSTPLWQAMSHLRLTFRFADLGVVATSDMYVDMDYVTGDGLLTVASNENTPRAMFNCIAYGARLARSILQSSFWEFGAPNYPRRRMTPKPDAPDWIGGYKKNATIPFLVERSFQRNPDRPAQLELRLHGYGQGSHRPPVLLIHGLAQGSLIFAHERLPVSMARHFLDAGYEVWLLDYRLSNQFGDRQIPYDGWSIDEIGAFDIPVAVTRVHELTGQKVHIFAHCVGAVGMSMAILDGKLDSQKVASLVLNAIHPWVMPSPFNHVRAKLGIALRDHIRNDGLDPIIQGRDDINATQTLLDRIGFSVARIDETPPRHSVDDGDLFNAICDRMTFLYGRMWEHANVSHIHPHWKDLVGRAPGAVYRHLHHMLLRERVVDREGRDIYVTPANLEHWKGIRTLFIHGELSMVFNPQSATRSAIRLRKRMRELGHVMPVRLRRVPGYGHMDVILADDAAARSFQYIDHFFRGHFDASDTYQPDEGPLLQLDPFEDADDPSAKDLGPRCGPIMRAARVEDDQLIVRYWLERRADEPAGANPVRFLNPPPDRYEILQTPELGSEFVWIDATYYKNKWPQFPTSWITRLPGVPTHATQDCHFIVASCWYPGMPTDRERNDQSFNGIANVIAVNAPCDAMFLVGDQIYADANGGILDPSTWLDRYARRYQEAFRAGRASRPLSMIPTHFAIDDHEIANDYAGWIESEGVGLMPGTERIDRIKHGDIDGSQLAFAKHTARSYIGAARDAKDFGTSSAAAGDLSYILDPHELACPVFILDTRSERLRAAGGEPALLFARDQAGAQPQLEQLLQWLEQLAGDPRPKFIVSGSVIVPIENDLLGASLWMRHDCLTGYPHELGRIIDRIAALRIPRVVFVSGDLHLSAIAKLDICDAQQNVRTEAVQIVASALYAPMPFVNTSRHDIEWNNATRIAAGQGSINYTPYLLSDAPAHFIKVGATRVGNQWKIAAAPYDPNGNPLPVPPHPSIVL